MENQSSNHGKITWVDITVDRAEQLRDFYQQVVGWHPEPVSMGEYDDFSMLHRESGAPAAGICHARGVNSGLPAQWLVYVTVPDLDISIERCRANGGQVIHGPRSMGDQSRFCVIQDPAGAFMALFCDGKSGGSQ